MITNKYIEKIVAVIVLIAAIICSYAVLFSDTFAATSATVTMAYEEELFDTSDIITLNIIMPDADWQDLLDNAINEEYYACDVEVNGTMFYNVGIRAKGNTSLSTVYSDPTTERYGFKIEFDHYVSNQTCFGLDKLVLNANYADATSMKEAIIYDMFQYIDGDASLYNYADISINGETWGVYLALEAVEDSFLLRNFGVVDSTLYKPDSTGGGGGGMKANRDTATDGDMATIVKQFENMTEEELAAAREQFQNFNGGAMPEMPTDATGTMPEMPTDTTGEMPTRNTEQKDTTNATRGGGGFSMFGNGSDLNYIDDSVDSYSTIWESAVIDTNADAQERVVTALKNISEQNDVETYMDVESVIKYLAVHTFAVNLDSLSGTMTHNYYLYEEDGALSILPWDYNLAFGGFQSQNASDTINFPIDTPFSSSLTMEDREFFAAILENEEYLAQYHEYLRILCEEYVNGGVFEEVYTRIRSQIDTLVANDPNAFYSYEAYDEAATLFCEVLSLRAESIIGQLNGTIPSTNDGQRADSSSLIDSSGINLSTLGTMNTGRGNMTMTRGEQTTDGATSTDTTAPTKPSATTNEGTNTDSSIIDATTTPTTTATSTSVTDVVATSTQNITFASVAQTDETLTATEMPTRDEMPTDGEMPTRGNKGNGEMPTGEAPTGEAPTGDMPSRGEVPTGEVPTGDMPSRGETPTGETATGETPTGETPSRNETTGNPTQSEQTESGETPVESDTINEETTTENSSTSTTTSPFSNRGDMSQNNPFSNAQTTATSQNNNLVMFGISGLVILVGIVIAKFYPRR